MRDFFPDLCETTLNSINYFTFLLPTVALGIDSDMIIEISVDYGYSPDKKQVIANIWARENDSYIKGFIMTVHIVAGDNDAERIFNELNSNEEVTNTLIDYIDMICRHNGT